MSRNATSTSESKRAGGIPRSACRGGWRTWAFRIAAVALSLSPLVLLELGLRLVGFGHNPRLVEPIPQPTTWGTHRLNPAADRAYYGRMDLLGPEPRPFVLPKPPGIYRIVVVGGSTVAGFPYPFELAMPRQLQVVLEQQSPEQKFEVLNAGITAINTLSEVDLVRQAIACEPDLIVVHSGHNEFYGPGGAASTASAFVPQFHPLLHFLRHQRVFQLAGLLLPRPLRGHPQETFPADIAIPQNGPIFARALKAYEDHLREMVRLAADAEISILLTTVPCNLRDQSPMHSLSRTDLTEEQRKKLNELLQAAERHASYREYEASLAALTTARQMDPDSAILAYRQAQCLEALGHREAAAAAYTLAADLDGCRFRAPSAFHTVVQQVASEGADSVGFCDVAARLRELSQFPAPGEDFFLEHVHYNLEGNWRVALILGQHIQEQILRRPWQSERVSDAARRDALLGVTPFDRLAADTFALMVVQAWPLSLAPDSGLQAARVKARIAQTFASLSAEEQKIFADLSLDAIQQDLLGGMAVGYRAAGREDRAAEMLRLRRLRRPWEATD